MNKLKSARFKAARLIYIHLAAFLFAGLKKKGTIINGRQMRSPKRAVQARGIGYP